MIYDLHMSVSPSVHPRLSFVNPFIKISIRFTGKKIFYVVFGVKSVPLKIFTILLIVWIHIAPFYFFVGRFLYTVSAGGVHLTDHITIQFHENSSFSVHFQWTSFYPTVHTQVTRGTVFSKQTVIKVLSYVPKKSWFIKKVNF